MLDRTSLVEQQFLSSLEQETTLLPIELIQIQLTDLNKDQAISIFDSQIKSRILDLLARKLKEKHLAYYTIGSCGHEGNAVFGAVLRKTDPAFLHYRSGAFFIQRAKKDSMIDPVHDLLLSFIAAKDDPISGGRHKVFGSLPLFIPPQTSTIASHLPKALGAAFSIARAKDLKINSMLLPDSVIICSFGDASVNHASAQTTLNACSWLASQSYPLPIIFICEDNGIGISVPTAKTWIESTIRNRPFIHYLACDGLNIFDLYQKTKDAEILARKKKQPVFLHMRCSRLLGHAGSDLELQYSTEAEIREREKRDPLIYTATILRQMNWLRSDEILALYEKNKLLIEAQAENIINLPKLNSAAEIMTSIVPKIKKKPNYLTITPTKRQEIFGNSYSQLTIKRNLCTQINFALTDLMLKDPNIILFGEDVGKKGGVYRVTAGLQNRFGKKRVFDTLLDETTILGTAIGMAHNGFVPIPEIQFLAYLHNAEDQLRGEAATLSFFSNGQYRNPMIIRIAALAYQKGFGGHFHNDNSIAVLRDLPGVIVACPSNGPDAAKMLRTCHQLASVEGRVIVFLEPIALYMTKDLHKTGDLEWLFLYPEVNQKIELGEVGVYGEGEIVIITFGNGFYLARQAAKILEEQKNIKIKIIDLRWLSPLPTKDLLSNLSFVKGILIVDEGRESASISEGLFTLLMENGYAHTVIKRQTGKDCFIPLGTSWQYLLPSKESIVNKVVEITKIIQGKEGG